MEPYSTMGFGKVVRISESKLMIPLATCHNTFTQKNGMPEVLKIMTFNAQKSIYNQ